MNEVLQAISTVGFPIVMCLVLCWYVYQSTQTHKEETEQLRLSLENNTIALTRLIEKMEN